MEIPTPLLTDEAFAALSKEMAETDEGTEDDEEGNGEDEDWDCDKCRRMDLCACQTGRAIQAARPVFERLMQDLDPEVAAAAGLSLLLWPTLAAGRFGMMYRLPTNPNGTIALC